MKPKSILVVEDRDALRSLLKGSLEVRGFRVADAADEEEARRRSEELGADLDVVLLDIELGRGGNGLDFGMWLKEEWRRKDRWLPEFLVYSAHEKADYYQAAIRLGAGAYLRKGDLGGDPGDPVPARPIRMDRVEHHVKALALRRVFRGDYPNGAKDINVLVRKSHCLDDALERFCRELLTQELEATLGGDFVLLLGGRSRGAVGFAGSKIRIDKPELLTRIDMAIHDRLGSVEPLIIDRSLVGNTLSRLDGAVFFPLGEIREYRLSLGLVPGAGSAENVGELARILGQYLSSAVLDHWLRIIEAWAKLETERRMIHLRATSDFCLYQGQELQTLLQEAERQAKEQDGKIPLEKLHAVAEELRGAGEMLAQVELLADRTSGGQGSERIEMDELLRHRWSTGLSGHLRLPEAALQVDRQCAVEAPKVEVEKAVSQILFWLGRRLTRLPRREDGPREIRCHLEQDGGRATILFEEHTSRRMPKRMRDRLFAPLTSLPLPEPPEDLTDETLKGHRLGLYLARILMEAVGGTLEEDSDAIPGDLGHRFVLQLPAAS